MRHVASIVFLLSVCLGSALADTYIFREKDGKSEFLYQATCMMAKGSGYCKLESLKVSGPEATMPCTLIVQRLLDYEPATRPAPGTWAVSVSAGLCGYTNTYVFSETGMVQTKTSPPKVKSDALGLCESFPPRTYNATYEKFPAPKFFTHGCTEMKVIFN